MERVSQEGILFEKSLRRTNRILSVTGLWLDANDTNRTPIEILRHRLFFCFNFLWFNTDVFLQIIWLIDSILIDRDIIEITYFMPCLTLCLLGDLKAFYFIKYSHQINDVVNSLRKLQVIAYNKRPYRDEVEKDLLKKQIPNLNMATYSLLITNIAGILLFASGPLIIAALQYKETGEIHLGMPFLLWYPFDPSNLKIWPFVYIHQMWSSINAVFIVIGPDNYFSTCCTFINVGFHNLQYDIERIRIKSKDQNREIEDKTFNLELIQIIERHRELIRCVELLEVITTKCTLFNVATSSLIICVTGFNVTTFDNYILMTPFICFLLMGLFQIFIFCYYGDLLMQSSTNIGSAVYNSQWYNGSATVMRDMLIVAMRSRRVCKLTAFGFADINLKTFGRIMSTAWSYFALLKTVYR